MLFFKDKQYNIDTARRMGIIYQKHHSMQIATDVPGYITISTD